MKTKPLLVMLFCIPCVSLRGQVPQFTEVAEVSGLWDSSVFEMFDRANQSVWVDFDRDDDLDLFFTIGHQNDLFRNQGDGTFVSSIRGTGLEDSANIYLGSTWEDMDNDGLIDGFFKTEMSFPLLLYRNSGNDNFENITSQAGLATEGGVVDATWMDYNEDGFSDLFVCNRLSETLVFRNNGDLTFTNVTNGSGLEADSSWNVSLSWSDYDNDGDMDLYIAREQTSFSTVASSLYEHNSDHTFTDVGEGAGVKIGDVASVAVWGDYDRDGFFDLYLGRTNAPNRLFRNLGNRTFAEVSVAAGVAGSSATRTASWVDFNNDGWLDLHVVNFDFQGNPEPDHLYLNNGDGTFEDVTQEAGIDEVHTGPHAVWGDYDRDGDMDVFLSHHHVDSETGEHISNFLFRNESINNWLEVNLETSDFKTPVGTKVMVYRDNEVLIREATNGSIQSPQISNRHLFGLQQHSMVDSVAVVWPDGEKGSLSSINANSVLIAREGQGIVTSVDEVKTPDTFNLSQNYPNPFNPETNIEYQIRMAAHVLIAVYNLKGQLVKRLVDEFKPAGHYRAVWDGTDNKGEMVSSGVYFYRLNSGGASRSRKMILMQ